MSGMNDEDNKPIEDIRPLEDNKPLEETPDDKSPNHTKEVWLGIGLLALLHLLLFLVPIALFFIGIVQILYLIPAMIIFHKKSGILQGLLIGAGVTFLLNAACFGLFISGTLSL